jgi:hypothetical protein
LRKKGPAAIHPESFQQFMARIGQVIENHA